MNENEQRITIAESLGAVCIDQDGNNKLWFRWHGKEVPNTYLPDFPRDLNAMFIAWRDGLNEQQQWEFGDELDQIIRRECPEADTYRRQALETNATAAWRAEAFLKAKGLWKE